MGSVASLASVYTLYLGFVFERKVMASLHKSRTQREPNVCVLMPCKGSEFNLARNIEAVLNQEYDKFRLTIIVDSEDDPAYEIARTVLEKHSKFKSTKVLISRKSQASGKVAALTTALEATSGQGDVYAFVDSDSFTSKNWLKDLVTPLTDQTIGSTTGFRWYIPLEDDFWSHVQASWNASGTNLMFDDRFNFPWGGSMALRTETLEKVGLNEVWAEAISDDLTLNCALRAHGFRIVFVPQCMVASFIKTTREQFFEWATRQTALTRAYNRGVWKYAAIAYGFFNFTCLLGLAAICLGFWNEPGFFIPAILLLLPQLFGVFRSIQRCRTFARAMAQVRGEIEKAWLSGAAVSFIVPWIMTYCIIRSLWVHEITWRGRTYKLTEMNPLAPPRSLPETTLH